MSSTQDGPRSALFAPVNLRGNSSLADLALVGVSEAMASVVNRAPRGTCVGWGIPFEIGQVVVVGHQPFTVELNPIMASWLIFMHTSDVWPELPGPHGFITPMRGEGQLAELAAEYVMIYEDGTEARAPIRRRHQLGTFQRRWGENCFEAVAHRKPHPVMPAHERPGAAWGWSQTRVQGADFAPWINWSWAWENPNPQKAIVALRFEPVSGTIVVSAVSTGNASSLPLRWRTRRKACLTLPDGESFRPELDENGLVAQISLDLGQVISAVPRLVYPNDRWRDTYNNQVPHLSAQEVLVEYTAHPDACFHLADGQSIPVAQVESGQDESALKVVAAATQRVTLRAVDRGSGKPVAVKLHVHGAAGEYLAPIDRHRLPNPAWFEDYSVDFTHFAQLDLVFASTYPLTHGIVMHPCTYVPPETTLDLPLGLVYVEAAKGFEMRPVRTVFEVTADTAELVVELERVLPWRERGWVTADIRSRTGIDI